MLDKRRKELPTMHHCFSQQWNVHGTGMHVESVHMRHTLAGNTALRWVVWSVCIICDTSGQLVYIRMAV